MGQAGLLEVLTAWGDVELGEAMTGGNRSVVVSACLRGSRVVVRHGRRSEAALEWELDLMGRLRESGLVTPEVVPTLDGRRQVDEVNMLGFVQGRRPTTMADWERVAAYLVQLHELGRGVSQRPGFRSAGDLLTEERGGDVDLRVMPDGAVRRCRRAREALSGQPTTVVHGDPGASNVLITETDVVLVDWDEAWVDCPWFDLAALPDAASPLHGEQQRLAARAADAWEAAVSWQLEPDYARRRLQKLE
jgi:Ser/Thr protein kinase RdoA (MazF antagonist)